MILSPTKQCKRIHVIGPSGAGKTFLIASIRASKSASTFDLDSVGYRRPNEKWSDWTINTNIYSLLVHNAVQSHQSIIIAGCDSHIVETVIASKTAGFTIVGLIPSVETLIKHRTHRKDTAEKVRDSESSVNLWHSYSVTHKFSVFSSVADILRFIDDGGVA